MCGVAGIFNPHRSPTLEQLTSMAVAIQHRGPDADGFMIDGPCGLAHRRLSIIDLSSVANQPMTSTCGRYVMVYNGEVYNFREIREEILKNKSVPFKTTSDSEVVLEAFALWGADCVQRFNGMFVMGIWDREDRKLHFFRDRLGIKPLFIYQKGNTLAFASEIKAIRALREFSEQLTVDDHCIADYLHLGYIPEPHTLWKQIQKFPAGAYACYDGQNLDVKMYWSAVKALKAEVLQDGEEALIRLKELLVSSVKMRLVSDVPFGTFLSGGIDSSLVTALAQSVHDAPLNTFSIGFDESAFDESGYAKAVAEALGTKHHEFRVTEKEARELIPVLPGIYDEPYADSSAIPTLMVSRLARQHVTMTLSGDGGDELFMGYGAYRWAQRLDSTFWKWNRKPAAALMKMGNSRYQRIAKVLQHENVDVPAHIFSQEQGFFTAAEIRKIYPTANDYRGYPFELTSANRTFSAAEKQAFFDLTHYLKDDLLVKVDRASMFHSLENRVPLLDYRLVEFSLNLAVNHKFSSAETKILLRKALFSYLPENLFNRPKWGFSIPLSKWMKGPLKDWMLDSLKAERLQPFGIDDKAVSELLEQYLEKGSDYLYARLWQLAVLSHTSV